MQTIVTFNLLDYDDISPEEICISLGMTPKRIFRKGIQGEGFNKTPDRRNGLIFESPEKEQDDFFSFEKQVAALFDLLTIKKEVLKPYCDKYYAVISCGIYLDTSTEYVQVPAIRIHNVHNDLINYLNLNWDFDIIVT